jgi:tetratricopeptide (TPR) repeat protein
VHHGVNIGLHALVSVFVWLVYRRIGGDVLVSMAGVFLFASHALHTETVAGVGGRADLLVTLFFLVSFLAYTHCREAGGRRLAGRYLVSLAAYLLALLSKESAVTLLGVILLFDTVFRVDGEEEGLGQRLVRTVGRGWPLYAGYLLVTLLYLAMRIRALGWEASLPPVLPSDNPLVMLDLPWRVVTALQVALRYLGLLFFPLHLAYDYSYNQIPLLTSLSDLRSWWVMGLSVLLIVAVIWSYRVSKEFFFWIVFSLVTYSVVSNLVILIGTIMGERLVYLSSVGFCLALPLVIRGLCNRLPLAPGTMRSLFLGVLVLIVGLHSVRTAARNMDWESPETLYLHDFQIVPNSTKALINAAHALVVLGREAEAITLLEGEIRRGAQGPVIYNNLGFVLIDKEIDVTRGVTLLEKALEHRPNDPEFLDSLGWGYYKLGRLAEASELLQRSLALDDWSASTPDRRAHLEAVERALGRAALEGDAGAEPASP